MIKKESHTSIFAGLNTRLLVFAMIQNFLSGATFYGIPVINVPQPIFKQFVEESIKNNYGPNVTDVQLYWIFTLLVASTTAGPLLGSFLLSFMAAKLGRRNVVMIWNNIFLIIGCILQAVAIPILSTECLFIGRIINGVVIGLYSIVPVYLAECSPDGCRGLISMTVGIGWTFWLLISAVMGLPQLLGM